MIRTTKTDFLKTNYRINFIFFYNPIFFQKERGWREEGEGEGGYKALFSNPLFDITLSYYFSLTHSYYHLISLSNLVVIFKISKILGVSGFQEIFFDDSESLVCIITFKE